MVKNSQKLTKKPTRKPRNKASDFKKQRRSKPGKKNFKGIARNNKKFNTHNEKNKTKQKSKSSNFKKEEEEIQYIENENELFDDKGYYNNNDVNEEDWGEDTTNVNLSEALFKKMNEVEEKRLDPRIIEAYTMVGDILKAYTSGKLPKAFNILPSTENWEELLDVTKPYNWSPMAMYEATIMFSSGLNSPLAEIFYSKYLLPSIRSDINKNKKLNIHYYNCLKKAIFKPAGFFKGIILPLSNNANAKEASIVGSILKKCSIPVTHSSACLMKLMEFCLNAKSNISMGALYFMKILLLKKYALPTPVKEAFVEFFLKYLGFQGKLPVQWHQALLLFVQIYKLDLTEEEKGKLKVLINAQHHHLISEEIAKELNYVPFKTNFGNMMIDN